MKRSSLKRKTPLRAKKPWNKTKTAVGGKRASTGLLKPKKRRKKTDLGKAKDKLWELCKQITRAVYGNICFTCGKTIPEWKNVHTGHFITDATCSTELSYDLRNLRPQCYHCNINLSGNWFAYELRLIEEEGSEYVAELKERNRYTTGLQYNILWYQKKIEDYTKILHEVQSSDQKWRTPSLLESEGVPQGEGGDVL